jgi:DNA-binding response OmpR family regulator
VARVAALIPDLLFGSKLTGMLEQAGHEVDLITSELEAWDEVGGIDVLIVDLVSVDFDGVTLLETLKTGGELHGVGTLAVYSHVDADTRRRALEAGFDLVVPRSRLMREGADLLDGLARR